MQMPYLVYCMLNVKMILKEWKMNYIEKLGRMSEVQGETSWYDDLYLKLIIDSAAAVADQNKSAMVYKNSSMLLQME